MELSRVIAEQHRHQNAILAHLDAGRPLLARPIEEVRGELARRRWELVRLLRAYQLFKHSELFDPLIRGSDPVRRDAAAALKARCVELGDAFADHVRRWSGADIAAGWPDYARAAKAIADRLATHLLRERDECARLLGEPVRRGG